MIGSAFTAAHYNIVTIMNNNIMIFSTRAPSKRLEALVQNRFVTDVEVCILGS